MEEKKHTLGESALILAGVPVAFVGICLLFIPLSMYCAWCDMHIWNRFAAPYFHLGPMSLWISFGIGYWIRLQTMSTKVIEGEKTSAWQGTGLGLLAHTMLLLTAFVIHKYIA